MALTNLQYLGTVLLKNISHGHGTEALQSFIDEEGDVRLGFARALEVEASNVMFSFSAGDTSVDKSKYAANLMTMARQVRADFATMNFQPSAVVSWSGSAGFGTAEVDEWIDTDYNEPNL